MRFKCGKCDNMFSLSGIKESIVTCSKCGVSNRVVVESADVDVVPETVVDPKTKDIVAGSRVTLKLPVGTVELEVLERVGNAVLGTVVRSTSQYWKAGDQFRDKDITKTETVVTLGRLGESINREIKQLLDSADADKDYIIKALVKAGVDINDGSGYEIPVINGQATVKATIPPGVLVEIMYSETGGFKGIKVHPRKFKTEMEVEVSKESDAYYFETDSDVSDAMKSRLSTGRGERRSRGVARATGSIAEINKAIKELKEYEDLSTDIDYMIHVMKPLLTNRSVPKSVVEDFRSAKEISSKAERIVSDMLDLAADYDAGLGGTTQPLATLWYDIRDGGGISAKTLKDVKDEYDAEDADGSGQGLENALNDLLRRLEPLRDLQLKIYKIKSKYDKYL